MTLNVRQLTVFRLLMQTRNVTETARLLRVSQPAASQTLRELEEQLGLKLFVRHGGRISPTAEARLLVQDTDRLLLQFDQIATRAAELRDARAGSLSIAAIPTVAGSILPRAVAAFNTDRPQIRISMNACDKAEVLRNVREERADLGIVYAPADDPEVVEEPLLQTSMLCVLPPGHGLANEPHIGLKHLFRQTVIMHPSTSPSLLLQERLHHHAPRFEATLDTNFSFGAVALVKEGVGIFVTEPVILLSGVANGLDVRPFKPDVPLVLTAIYSRHRPVSRVLMRFMTTLRSMLQIVQTELNAWQVKAELL
jgi:DNA-binding transcriptional LysR family regulator